MSGLVTAAWVGVGIAAYGAHESEKANDEAVEASRKSEAAKQRMASADAAKARLEQVREARIRRAQIVASGANTGLGSSTSGVAGAISSISSQAAANIGSINQAEGFAQQISYYNQQAADARTDAANAQAWGQVGMQVAGMAVQRIK